LPRAGEDPRTRGRGRLIRPASRPCQTLCSRTNVFPNRLQFQANRESPVAGSPQA